MHSDLNNYLHFLTETLGVKNIFDFEPDIQPNMTGSEAVKAPLADSDPALHCVFIVEDLGDYSAVEKDLLNKMVAAAKTAIAMDEKQYQILDLNDDTSVYANYKIFFKNRPSSEATHEVYSPKTLTLHPEYKKKAWEDMKRILQIV